ncbi:MAG: EF-P lysine aminoacylase EpmA [Methylobacter sp.]|nr:EF-P lysine aminoacylase EpmA [Methylobacter sp.]MDP2097620.1 EF-P lysine aminoacylase EpmA [Methylobacter sp.]MDP2428522.1 EF-P lysine aminoacylase EpmA [Methylobacter sp.]MDP3056266.1 EF-P lysine aminoacylase EpmA [Methylobacter sp.]MDP3363798.1 EF-P lysine aminoacylase EpmA [Methylobacter sp.]
MGQDWRPSCAIELLQLRARMLAEIRQFFADRAVLEVETPLLSNSIGTDPQLEFFTAEYRLLPTRQTLFLQTSPEFAMKRLLAAGSGCIYQIGKAFRNGESGRFHNPEFTMLEWYRVGFSLPQLMDEIAGLIGHLFREQPLQETQRVSYQDAFFSHTGLDPLVFSYPDYCAYARQSELPEAVTICGHDHALWLDFLFSHKVQPHLGNNALCMVYGYPACQSSLARINEHNALVSDRVEVFINGVELGNGYHELTDADEQNKRFDKELAIRQQQKLPVSVKDQRLVAALASGLPQCSGMAIGLDRLLMLLSGSHSINEVLSFPIHRA